MTTSTQSGSVVVCTYRVQAGKEEAFEKLLAHHIPTLRRLGLITNHATQTLRRSEGSLPIFVEVFEWANDLAAKRASEVPEVVAIWEPMAALCEERNGQPGIEFPGFERVPRHRSGPTK